MPLKVSSDLHILSFSCIQWRIQERRGVTKIFFLPLLCKQREILSADSQQIVNYVAIRRQSFVQNAPNAISLRPHWWSLQRSPKPLDGFMPFYGAYFKAEGRRGEERGLPHALMKSKIRHLLQPI